MCAYANTTDGGHATVPAYRCCAQAWGHHSDTATVPDLLLTKVRACCQRVPAALYVYVDGRREERRHAVHAQSGSMHAHTQPVWQGDKATNMFCS